MDSAARPHTSGHFLDGRILFRSCLGVLQGIPMSIGYSGEHTKDAPTIHPNLPWSTRWLPISRATPSSGLKTIHRVQQWLHDISSPPGRSSSSLQFPLISTRSIRAFGPVFGCQTAPHYRAEWAVGYSCHINRQYSGQGRSSSRYRTKKNCCSTIRDNQVQKRFDTLQDESLG